MSTFFNNLLNQGDEIRYERKFQIHELMFEEIEHILKHNASNFKETYQQRWVNNIYFDTPSLSSYWDNVEGKAERVKVRIRWYGTFEGSVEQPMLEIKIKKGLSGNKIRFALNKFQFNKEFIQQGVQALFDQADMPDDLREYLKDLKVTLANRYLRKYYVSFNKKFRATLDTQLQFYDLTAHQWAFKNNLNVLNDTILEIKYHPRDEKEACRMTTISPFHLSRHSKYIRGVEQISL